MEKLNIAELLKDCPQGMELDCTLFEGLEFDGIVDNEFLPIRCRIKNSKGGYNIHNFTEYGQWDTLSYAKCVIFPKGKTTWEGFVPTCQLEDGKIVATSNGLFIGIIKVKNNRQVGAYCSIDYSEDFRINSDYWFNRMATEEEKTKLFDAIKANGYKWNEETKTLEKLIEPKFKVGDRVQNKNTNMIGTINLIINDEREYQVALKNGGITYILFEFQDSWELVPNKFNISNLKPFDKVLVRCSSLEKWHIDFFEVFNGKNKYSFTCLHNNRYNECIPYEGNEHLLNTNKDCDEYFKNW